MSKARSTRRAPRGRVVVILMYEPAVPEMEPIPLSRVCDNRVAVAAANSALFEAEKQAKDISISDQLLGEMGQIEARRLRELFGLIVPGFRDQDTLLQATKNIM
jgi:hypothetical protein